MLSVSLLNVYRASSVILATIKVITHVAFKFEYVL
jgi:hypothetical protein